MIPVYSYGLTVTLTRVVNRASGHATPTTAPFRGIDLTSYLGDAGSVRTIKDINHAAGGFTVVFGDRMHPEFGDTVYALVEPMDLIEIRASRSPQNYQGQNLPLVMRGFVSLIERQEAMGQDGTPQRTVTISGQDAGKLWLINHVYFEMLVLKEQNYLNEFHLQTATGIQIANLAVSEFMRQIVDRVMNPRIEQMSAFADTQLRPFILDASVADGIVLPNLAAGLDAISLWQLADTFADRPWNELFVEDAEEGPHLVFRPTPFKGYEDGAFIMNGAIDPGHVDIDIVDIVAMTISRSDSRVANFFWVPPGVSQLDANAMLTAAALVNGGWPFDFAHDNNTPVLFGLRKMTAQSNLYPGAVTDPVNMLPRDAQSRALGAITTWIQARGRQLMLLNRDNAAWEEGGMVVKGNERLTVGQYLRVTRGDLQTDAYITQVAQSFSPLAVWTTSLQVIRGNGFKVRNEVTGGAPYIMEGRRSPYS